MDKKEEAASLELAAFLKVPYNKLLQVFLLRAAIDSRQILAIPPMARPSVKHFLELAKFSMKSLFYRWIISLLRLFII